MREGHIVDVDERYKLIIEQIQYASEVRLKLLGWWGASYGALGALFVWWLSKDTFLGYIWLVPVIGILVALIFWALDWRNGLGIGAAQKAGRDIEESPSNGIPEAQRFLKNAKTGLSHGLWIMVGSVFVIVCLSWFGGFLYGWYPRSYVRTGFNPLWAFGAIYLSAVFIVMVGWFRKHLEGGTWRLWRGRLMFFILMVTVVGASWIAGYGYAWGFA